MKHLKGVTKKSGPARAFVWDRFVNLKTLPPGPGIIFSEADAKAAYAGLLAGSPDSIDLTDLGDLQALL